MSDCQENEYDFWRTPAGRFLSRLLRPLCYFGRHRLRSLGTVHGILGTAARRRALGVKAPVHGNAFVVKCTRRGCKTMKVWEIVK